MHLLSIYPPLLVLYLTFVRPLLFPNPFLQDHFLYGVNVKKGSKGVILHTDTSEPIESSPTLNHDGTKLFISSGSQVHAISTKNGKKLWLYDTHISAKIITSPVLTRDENVLLVSSHDLITNYRSVGSEHDDDGGAVVGDILYALDTRTGQELWNFTTQGLVGTLPIGSRDGQRIYYGASTSGLFVINATDGQLLTTINNPSLTGHALSTSALSHDERVMYVGGKDAMLYAINLMGNDGDVPLAMVVDGYDWVRF